MPQACSSASSFQFQNILIESMSWWNWLIELHNFYTFGINFSSRLFWLHATSVNTTFATVDYIIFSCCVPEQPCMEQRKRKCVRNLSVSFLFTIFFSDEQLNKTRKDEKEIFFPKIFQRLLVSRIFQYIFSHIFHPQVCVDLFSQL